MRLDLMLNSFDNWCEIAAWVDLDWAAIFAMSDFDA